MKTLNTIEIGQVSAGSFFGVIGYSTIGFWTGGIIGFCMGGLPAIPGALMGLTVGAYLGTDGPPPQVIIIKECDHDKHV